MTLHPQFVVLRFIDKWKDSTITSRSFVGISFWYIAINRLQYGWMGKPVHEVVVVVSVQTVNELDWRFGAKIGHILTLCSSMQTPNRLSLVLVGEYFSRTLWLRADCQNAISPTEVVQQDVLCSLLLDAFHCNSDSNASVSHSLQLLPSSCRKGDDLEMFKLFETSSLFVNDFKTIVLFEQIETKFVLQDGSYFLWEFPSAWFWTLCSRRWSFFYGWSYCTFSSRIVVLVFFWGYSTDSLLSFNFIHMTTRSSFSSVWSQSHANPFNRPDSLRLSMDVSLLTKNAVLLYVSIDP